eukprot:12908677-Prorocentrum_lima.AAC.1
MLFRALPDKLKARVFEEVDGYDTVYTSSLFILDVVWDNVASCGQDELQGLIKYARYPGVASTVEEALKMLR